MKTTRCLVHAILVAATAALMPCNARNSAEVSVRATSLSGGGAPEQFELCLNDKGETQPLEVSAVGFSGEVKLPRMETWRFGQWQTAEDGKRSFVVQCQVSPPVGDSLWLVFEKNEPAGKEPEAAPSSDESGASAEKPAEDTDKPSAPELPWDLHAINLDPVSLGEGGIVVLNLAPGTIEMEVNDQKRELAAGAVELLRAETESGKHFNVKFFTIQNGRRRPFVTTNWFLGEKRRRLAAVVKARNASVPKVIVVDEITSDTTH